MANQDNNPPESRGKRFLKLAGMTTSVMGTYAKSRVKGFFSSDQEAEKDQQATYTETGRRIAKTLGELKGAVMKVGQMASIGSELLPPELSQALSKLQKEAPPVNFQVISDQIEREFGTGPEMLFQRFDKVPFASASIGQVHRATTDDGREVVVKVQYPGVDRSVDSDLSQLKFALKAAGLVRLKRKVLNELFAEVRARLHEELDYTNEAENVRLFKRFHSDDQSIIVPDVVGERSSQRVLTLTYEPGDPLSDVKALGYDQETRNALGMTIVRMMSRQLFELRAIHADPNPANFACNRDGKLVVYDYGCIKKIDERILEAYKTLIRAFYLEDYEELDKGLLNIGARDPDGPDVPHEAYKRVRDLFYSAFVPDQPFDFGSSTIQRRLLSLAPYFRRHRTSFQPPVPIVFINRVVAGQGGNLRRIGAKVALFDELVPYFDEDFVNEVRNSSIPGRP